MKDIEENVWIWGMGEGGSLLYNLWREDEKYKIKGLIDNSMERQKYGNFTVLPFAEAAGRIAESDMVVCCCSLSYYKEMKSELTSVSHDKYKHFYDVDLSDCSKEIVENEIEDRLVSRICSADDFENGNFQRILRELGRENETVMHRKIWEWVYIIEVLEFYGMLRKGKSGIGFAVGTEPLPSYFASKGVDVLASDLGINEGNAKDWAKTNQNAGGNIGLLYKPDLCDEETFLHNVKYRNINMNHIPSDIGRYDFCWSSCAIEHVGSLALSKEFLKRMLEYLKPGGIAVHTTEFNLSSNDSTVESGDSVIFRKRDVEEMQSWFTGHGHIMEASFRRSNKEGNCYIDLPPFRGEGRPYHITLAANGYAETSFAFVIQKSDER